MRNFFRKIWDAIVSLFSKIDYDKWLHFIAGLLISSFCCIALGMNYYWCVVPAVAAGLLKELFDLWTTKLWDWGDVLATVIGGIIPGIFLLLNMWWF